MRVTKATTFLLLSVLLLMSGCSSQLQPVQSAGSNAAGNLAPSETHANTMQYIAAGVDLTRFTAFIIDPVEIYSGADAQFGNVSVPDQQAMAKFMHDEFVRVLGTRYKIVNSPGPNVLRIRLTLAGIDVTVPAAAAVTRVLPVGLVVNSVSAATGQSGTFLGSVAYAADFYDSETNVLVAKLVTRQEPNAMDVTVVLSSLDAARAGVTQGAQRLLADINRIHGKT